MNSLGYRGRELAPSTTTPSHRIVLVGGSSAFSTGVASDAQTFAVILEEEVGNGEVVNAAVIGFDSGQERVLLQTELLDLSPALVVALDGWNDLRLGRFNSRGTLLSAGFIQIENQSIIASRSQQSLLFTLRSILLAPFPRTLAPVLRPTLRPFHATDLPGSINARVQQYTQNHAAMAAACHAHGCSLLVILQPDRDAMADYQQFRKLAIESHRLAGLDIIDAADLINWTPREFMDQVHLTASANRALASAVAHHLRSVYGPARLRP